MSKKPKPFITRIQAEGTTSEKLLIQEELHKEAEKLSSAMPTEPADRQMYVSNLMRKAIREELDRGVFKLFVKMTNSYQEVLEVHRRAELLSKKEVTNGNRIQGDRKNPNI